MTKLFPSQTVRSRKTPKPSRATVFRGSRPSPVGGKDSPLNFMEDLRLAQDPSTPSETLQVLARKYGKRRVSDQGQKVTLAVASNPNMTPQALLQMASAPYVWHFRETVLEAISQNPIWDLALVEDPNLLRHYMDEDMQNLKSIEEDGLSALLLHTDFVRYVGGPPKIVDFYKARFYFYPNGVYGMQQRGGNFYLFPSRFHVLDFFPNSMEKEVEAFLDREEGKPSVGGKHITLCTPCGPKKMKTPKKAKVGATRTDTEIIMDPECDTELWWDLASFMPFEAMQSPLFPLLVLESPERWQRLVVGRYYEWIDTGLDRLPSEQDRQQFALDCLARVVPSFEASYRKLLPPAVKLLAQSNQWRRDFVEGKIDFETWHQKANNEYRRKLTRMANESPIISDTDNRYVLWAAREPRAVSVAHWCAASRGQGQAQEPFWQWNHLLQMLRQRDVIAGLPAKKKARVGAVEEVRHPIYGNKIEWGHDAKYMKMPEDELRAQYEKANDPSTPSDVLEEISLFWLKSNKHPGALDVITQALAQNPNNTLIGLRDVYGWWPEDVRKNPALALFDLEDPTRQYTKLFDLPLLEVWELGATNFENGGRGQALPSWHILSKIWDVIHQGYSVDDLLRLGPFLNTRSHYAASIANDVSSYWKWLLHWWRQLEGWWKILPEESREEPFSLDSKGLAWTIIPKAALPLLHQGEEISDQTSISTRWLEHGGSRHVNDPNGDFPMVYPTEAQAELAAKILSKRKDCSLKKKDMIEVPIWVSLRELQPLVNLDTTTMGLIYPAEENAALRKNLPPDRIRWTPSLRRMARSRKKDPEIGRKRLALPSLARNPQ